MCYIQMTIKTDKNRASNNVERVLRQQVFKAMYDNNDGFFLKNGKFEVKTLDRKQAYNALDQANMDGLIVHCRLATQGAVDISNVHGYSDGKWQLVHNGWAYGCSGSKEKSDSRIFFEILVRELANAKTEKTIAKKIQKVVLETEFRGRAILSDNENDRAFLFGDFQVYSINKQYLAICSSKQDFEAITIPYEVAGLTFEDKHGLSFKVLGGTIEGIYVINGIHATQPKFKFIQELKEAEYTSYGYTNRAWNDGYYHNYGYTGSFDDIPQGNHTKATPPEADRYYCSESGFKYYCTEATSEEGYFDLNNNFHEWSELIDQIEDYHQMLDLTDYDDLDNDDYQAKLERNGVPAQLPIPSEQTMCVAEIENKK